MHGDEDESLSEEELLDLLNDQYARCILLATIQEPMTARQLEDCCDASHPTIYRRANELIEANLLTKQTEVDPEGHHRNLYVATFDEVAITLNSDGLRVDIERPKESIAERFTRMYEDLR